MSELGDNRSRQPGHWPRWFSRGDASAPAMPLGGCAAEPARQPNDNTEGFALGTCWHRTSVASGLLLVCPGLGSSTGGCPTRQAGAPEFGCFFPSSVAAKFLGAQRSRSDCGAERAEPPVAPGKARRAGGSWMPLPTQLCFARQPQRAAERPGEDPALSFGSKRASEEPLKQP